MKNYVKDIFELFLSATKMDTNSEKYLTLDYAFKSIDKKIEIFLNIDEKTMKSTFAIKSIQCWSNIIMIPKTD